MKIAINRNPAPAQQIEAGRHIARIVQIVGVGLQKAFDPGMPPESKLGVAFELASGATIARTVSVNLSPASLLGRLVEAAGIDLNELATEAREFDADDLLAKSVAVEVEVRDARWPKVTGFGPLEAWDEEFDAKGEMITFDIDNPPADRAELQAVFLKVHPDLRKAISERVRTAPGQVA